MIYRSHSSFSKRKKRVTSSWPTLSVVLCAFLAPHANHAADLGGFEQSTWAGGVSANNGNHTSNQTNWSEYSSKDSGIALTLSDTQLELAPIAASITNTTNSDFDILSNRSKKNNRSDNRTLDKGTKSDTMITGRHVILSPTTYNTSINWTQNSNWFLGNLTSHYAIPIDLDADGDFDLISVNNSSVDYTYTYENIGTNEIPNWVLKPEWQLEPKHSSGIDFRVNVPYFPKPYDIDDDGDFDLVYGHGYAARIIRNIGTPFSPKWYYEPEATISVPGNDVNTEHSGVTAGFIDMDNDNDIDVYLGTKKGHLDYYRNDGTAAEPNWVLDETHYLGFAVEWYDVNSSRPHFVHLDGDDLPDLLLSNSRTGVGMRGYRNTGDPQNPWALVTQWGMSTNNSHINVADIDVDGDVDILYSKSGDIFGLENNSVTSYNTSGHYVSPVIDSGNHSGFNQVTFAASEPANTSITVHLRVGKTATVDDSWVLVSSDLTSGDDLSIYRDYRYYQYEVHMTSDGTVTPTFTNFEVTLFNYPDSTNVLATLGIGSNDVDTSLKLERADFALNSIGVYSTGTDFNNLLKGKGDYLYLVQPDRYLFQVIDISDPTTPTFVRNVVPWFANAIEDLVVHGDYLYVGADYKFFIYDITDPSNPAQIGSFQTELTISDVKGIAIQGNYAYLAANDRAYILDITDPTTPTEVWNGKFDWNLGSNGVGVVTIAVNGNLLYLSVEGRLEIVDISDPIRPEHIGGGGWLNADQLIVQNDILYAAGPHIHARAYDISNGGLVSLGFLSANDRTAITIRDDHIYVVDSEVNPPIITTWDISNPYDFQEVDVNNTLSSYYAAPYHDGNYLYFELYNSPNSEIQAFDIGNFHTSGSYSSAILEPGPNKSLISLDYDVTLPTNTAIYIDVRAGTTPTPDAPTADWTGWTAHQITVGGTGSIDLTGYGQRRYVQYQTRLETTNVAVTPEINSITLNYEHYAFEGELISSPFDTENNEVILKALAWQQTLPADTNITLQIRSAADSGGPWSRWYGPDGFDTFWDSGNTSAGECAGTTSITCARMAAGLRDMQQDRWFQYRVAMTTNGHATPSVSQVNIDYATATTGGISISQTSGLSVAESDTASITVQATLDSEPTQDVTFHLASSDITRGTVSPSTITFEVATWSSPRTITIYGVSDLYDDGTLPFTIFTGASSSLDSSFDDITPPNISVDALDDDSADIIINPNSGLVVSEDLTSAFFDVRLATQPFGNITIPLRASDSTELGIDKTSLTFTTDNWYQDQRVTVTGIDDVIIDDAQSVSVITDAAQIVDVLDSAYDNFDAVNVAVSNEDNDVAELAFSFPFGQVTKEGGGFAPFSFHLTAKPSTTVIVQLASDDETEAKVSTPMFMFTGTNWDTPQTASMISIDDFEPDGDVPYSIVTQPFMTSDPKFINKNPADVSMIHQDNDQAAIRIYDSSPLTTDENGATDKFKISLSSMPAEDVILRFSTDRDDEVSISPSSVTYTNSENPQYFKEITVTGVDDRVWDGNQDFNVNITIETADSNYAALSPSPLTGTNTDNELLVQEYKDDDFEIGLGIGVSDVNCDGMPDLLVDDNQGGATVYYNDGDIHFSGAPDWRFNFGNEAYSAGDINKDGCNDTLFTTGTSIYLVYGASTPTNATYWAVAGGSVAVGDFDNNGWLDIAAGDAAYGSNVGRALVYMNSLSGLPDADANKWATPAEADWIFYGVSKVAAANVNADLYMDLIIGNAGYDHHIYGNDGAVFAFHGSATGLPDSDDNGVALVSDANWMAAGFQNLDNAGREISSLGDLNGDGADEIIILSGFKDVTAFYGSPGTGLKAAVHSSGAVKVVDEADWHATPSFGNGDLGKKITRGGDINGDGYNDIVISTSTYQNSDGIRTGALWVYLGGESGLPTTPSRTIEGPLYGENYAQRLKNQNIFFGDKIGLADDIDGDGQDEFYVSTRGNGAYLYSVQIPEPGVRVTPSTGLVTSESGVSTEINVSLTAAPTAEVTLPLTTDANEATLSVYSLIFDKYNWNIPQAVTITGVDDAGDTDGNTGYLIEFLPISSADPEYDTHDAVDIAATNYDNDVPTAVSVSSQDANEWASAQFEFVRLGPIDDPLTVYYSVAGTAVAGSDYTSLPGNITIPASNMSATLTVNLINDDYHELAETLTIEILADAAYDLDAQYTTTMTIQDDDSAGINITPAHGLTTDETGNTAEFSVRLSSKPQAPVTIPVSSNDTTEGIVQPSQLVLDSSNWNSGLSVTISGVNDPDIDNDQPYEINLGPSVSSDGDYDAITPTPVQVTNRDDESFPVVTISTPSAVFTEGDNTSGSFLVNRTGDLTNSLAVYYSVGGSAFPGVDYHLLSGQVIIPAGHAATEVIVAGINDSDIESPETIILSLASGSGYVLGDPSINTLSISDDDSGPREPYVNFRADQVVAEGKTATVYLDLSNEALTYPVSIPFTVTGASEFGIDHDLTAGTVVINSGHTGSFSFEVLDDGLGDNDEQIVIQMGQPTNALAGASNTHTVVTSETNEPPVVSLTSSQGGIDSRIVTLTDGNVTVTAVAEDPNTGDTLSYDWSATNSALIDIEDGDETTFVFDPSVLEAKLDINEKLFKVRLTVTDNGDPAEHSSIELLLEVLYTAPVLSNVDSDNDGIDDASESFDDSDGDGIADYLDSANLNSNQLSLDTSTENYVMEVENGLAIKLGDIAFAAGADGASVSQEDIADYGNGEGLPGTASAVDDSVSMGGYFDFVVNGLGEAGQSIDIVIPLFEPIPSNAVYRKYDPTSGWRDFAVDADNAIASAPGLPGICPSPGSNAYQPGLNEGDLCIQLTIEDGGPNDADGLANYVVEDPGAIIQLDSSSRSNIASDTPSTATSGGGGGGGGGTSWFVLLLTLYIRRYIHSVQKISNAMD